jgi:hypothetical protein
MKNKQQRPGGSALRAQLRLPAGNEFHIVAWPFKQCACLTIMYFNQEIAIPETHCTKLMLKLKVCIPRKMTRLCIKQ